MLATGADWPDYVGVDPPENADALLQAASGLVRLSCGWNISRETVTEQLLDGSGATILFLPTLHLVDVTEVLIDGTAVTDYRKSAMGALYRAAGWPWGFENISASYVDGLDPVPAEVKALVVNMAARTVGPTPGLIQKTVGQVSYRWGDVSGIRLDLADERVLSRYRIAA
jgi:hypothetical protein